MRAGQDFANGMQNLTSWYLEKRRLDNQQKYYDMRGSHPAASDYERGFMLPLTATK